VFALQGGEYSTADLWKQRKLKQKLTTETDSLAREVDSLRREALQHHVTYSTTLAGARALVHSLDFRSDGAVHSLQELHQELNT